MHNVFIGDYHRKCELICAEAKNISLKVLFFELLIFPYRFFIGMIKNEKEVGEKEKA